MIKPYTAVGLIPTVRGIRKREDIRINLEHLSHLVKAASWLSSLDLPVRLIAFPEGALQAFNDEVLDLDHVTFARECAIDIPGEETEALGKIAKEYNAFVMAQAKARHPDWPDRYFNVGFILNPRGKVILKHYKVSPLFPVEHSVCPHDVYDWWVEKYGKTLDAFWPVVDTEIGRMGIMMANEGSYPENARARLGLTGEFEEVVTEKLTAHALGNEGVTVDSSQPSNQAAGSEEAVLRLGFLAEASAEADWFVQRPDGSGRGSLPQLKTVMEPIAWLG